MAHSVFLFVLFIQSFKFLGWPIFPFSFNSDNYIPLIIFIFAEEFQEFLSNHDELTVLLSSLLPPVETSVQESRLI